MLFRWRYNMCCVRWSKDGCSQSPLDIGKHIPNLGLRRNFPTQKFSIWIKIFLPGKNKIAKILQHRIFFELPYFHCRHILCPCLSDLRHLWILNISLFLFLSVEPLLRAWGLLNLQNSGKNLGDQTFRYCEVLLYKIKNRFSNNVSSPTIIHFQCR